jgi:hypothetical protein
LYLQVAENAEATEFRFVYNGKRMLANQHQYNKTDGQESEYAVRTAYCADRVRRASTQQHTTTATIIYMQLQALYTRLHNFLDRVNFHASTCH